MKNASSATASPVPLVLLPGLDGTGLLFTPLLACFPATIRPVVVCYPRHTVLSVRQLTDYVRNRLPAGQDFVLLGESYSAAIAVEVARSNPPGLRGLVLSAPSLRARRPPYLVSLLRWVPDRLFGVVPPRFVLRRWLLGRDAPSDLVEALRSAIKGVAVPALAARLREYLGALGCDRAGWPAIATLLIEPEQDYLRSRRSAADARPPHVEEVTIRGPHLVAQRAPREFAAVVTRFTAKVCGRDDVEVRPAV